MLGAALLLCAGCAGGTARPLTAPEPPAGARDAAASRTEAAGPAVRIDRGPHDPTPSGATAARGVYHTLEPGQTLYSLARAYGVSVETLVRVNRIADPSRLPDGMPIFIPGAARPLDVGPTFSPAPGSRDLPASQRNRPAAEADAGYSSASMLPAPRGPQFQRPPPGGSGEPPGGGPPEGGSPAPVPPRDGPHRAPGSVSLPTLQWPLHGEITSGFGRRRHRHAHHEGIDIDGLVGEPILAAAPGTVVRAGRENGYGRFVVVDHGGGLSSLYAHASRLLVHEGDRVEAGEEIARVGRSGNARGSHLHFEVHRDGRPVNPLPFLQATR